MDKVKKIIKGYIVSLVVFVVTTWVFAFLMKFTSLPESKGMLYLIFAVSAGCFFAGLIGGGCFKKRGLVYGVLLAAAFTAFIVFAVSMCFSSGLSMQILSPLYIIPLAAGGLGGIVGVNAKNQ